MLANAYGCAIVFILLYQRYKNNCVYFQYINKFDLLKEIVVCKLSNVHSLLLLHYLYSRVAEGCCQPSAPSEPDLRLSPHPAQASDKISLAGIPANLLIKSCFTLLV